MNTSLLASLSKLSSLELGSPKWREVAEQIVAELEPSVEAIGRRISRQAYLVWDRDRDDIVQIVRVVHWRQLQEVSVENVFSFPLEAWEAVLVTRARSAVRDWASTVDVTGISGFSGIARRRRSMYEVRERIEADFGELLSDEEVAETYNDRLMSSLGARVHSALAHGADMRGVRVSTDVDLSAYPGPTSVEGVVAEHLADAEAVSVVELAIAESFYENAELGTVARAWLSGSIDDGLPSASWVARKTRISPAKVRKHLRRVQALLAGFRLTGARRDATSIAIACAVADALFYDDRLGRVAELRWERWTEGVELTAERIAERMSRPVADVRRAIVVLDSFVDDHLADPHVPDLRRLDDPPTVDSWRRPVDLPTADPFTDPACTADRGPAIAGSQSCV